MTSLARTPAVDTLLVAGIADFQRLLLGVYSLGEIHIVDTFGEPHTEETLAANGAVEDFANFFCGLNFQAVGGYLPASLVFNNLTIAEGKAFIVSQLADGVDICFAVCSVLLNLSPSFSEGLFLSLCVFIIAQEY